MTFDSPIAASVAALIAAVTLFLLRKAERITRGLIAIGSVMIALAAGAVHVHWQRPATVVAMIDQSASTRTAAFHDANALEVRLKQLLPNTTVQKLDFSDPFAVTTEWNPPDAEAVLLFSDGQFELPTHMPPTWAVVDPALVHCSDAAVESVVSSADASIVARVRNSGEPRIAMCGDSASAIPKGGETIVLSSTSLMSNVHLNTADAWPENDALPLPSADAAKFERWWLGESPPEGWKPLTLPATLERFDAAGVIAVENAASLSPIQQACLREYVTALGGGLMFIDRHASSKPAVDDLSPLSADAPSPMRRWIILVDASGSMAQRDGSTTRFNAACAAARAMIRELPANDLVAVGAFARDLKWWLTHSSATEAQTVSLPPADFQVSGPTNLEPLLLELLHQHAADLATELIVITDSDALLDKASPLQIALSEQHVSLNVLSIDAANQSLARLAVATGGQVLTSADLPNLDDKARDLIRAAQPTTAQSASILYANEVHLPRRENVTMFATWLRDPAVALATTDAGRPAAAEWQRGSGRVVATAYRLTASELNAFADRVARQPTDPRIQIRVEPHRLLIDAANLPDSNGRDFKLSLNGATPMAFDQIAPGRYAAALSPAPKARVAGVQLDNTVLRRLIIPAHYAEEFDATGINLPKLREIARKSGGGVIEPDDVAPILLPRVRRDVSLAAPLASLGAACLVLAALRRKL